MENFFDDFDSQVSPEEVNDHDYALDDFESDFEPDYDDFDVMMNDYMARQDYEAPDDFNDGENW